MTWDNYDQRWIHVMGDEGPWGRHAPAAWAACARHDGAPVDIPERVWWHPSPDIERDNHADFLAYWTTPVHLLVYGLGWSRPDLGLHEWARAGLPEDEPVLRAVKRWWGEDGIYWFLEWAHSRGGLEVPIRSGVDLYPPLLPLQSQGRSGPHPGEVLRRPDGPENPFGLGGDEMHLTGHLGGPWPGRAMGRGTWSRTCPPRPTPALCRAGCPSAMSTPVGTPNSWRSGRREPRTVARCSPMSW